MVLGFAIAALSAVLAGGNLRRLSDLKFRYPGVLFAGLLAQVVIISILPDGNEGVREAVHIASYLLVFAFLALNWRVAGLPIIAVGALLNFAAITANGGVMPADPDAAARAGITDEAGSFENSRPVDDPKLMIFGDRFAIPKSWPFSNVFSIGDVLIVLGAAVGMHTVGGSRLIPRKFSGERRNAAPPAT
jgi:hypothetical protein